MSAQEENALRYVVIFGVKIDLEEVKSICYTTDNRDLEIRVTGKILKNNCNIIYNVEAMFDSNKPEGVKRIKQDFDHLNAAWEKYLNNRSQTEK